MNCPFFWGDETNDLPTFVFFMSFWYLLLDKICCCAEGMNLANEANSSYEIKTVRSFGDGSCYNGPWVKC